MTRQDFELIARVLRESDGRVSLGPILNHEQRRRLAHAFADELAMTNPRFDRERFVIAATRKD